jgi:hypothetical protein
VLPFIQTLESGYSRVVPFQTGQGLVYVGVAGVRLRGNGLGKRFAGTRCGFTGGCLFSALRIKRTLCPGHAGNIRKKCRRRKSLRQLQGSYDGLHIGDFFRDFFPNLLDERVLVDIRVGIGVVIDYCGAPVEVAGA